MARIKTKINKYFQPHFKQMNVADCGYYTVMAAAYHSSKYSVLYKTALLVIGQLMSIGIIIFELLATDVNTKCRFVDDTQHLLRKVMAFILSSLLSWSFQSALWRATSRGMLKVQGSKYLLIPKFMNATFIRCGFVMNAVILYLVYFGSHAVIFMSETTFDMVLNSMALYFISELPPMITGYCEYHHMDEAMNKPGYFYNDKMIWQVDKPLPGLGRWGVFTVLRAVCTSFLSVYRCLLVRVIKTGFY
eukprot:442733_1